MMTTTFTYTYTRMYIYIYCNITYVCYFIVTLLAFATVRITIIVIIVLLLLGDDGDCFPEPSMTFPFDWCCGGGVWKERPERGVLWSPCLPDCPKLSFDKEVRVLSQFIDFRVELPLTVISSCIFTHSNWISYAIHSFISFNLCRQTGHAILCTIRVRPQLNITLKLSQLNLRPKISFSRARMLLLWALRRGSGVQHVRYSKWKLVPEK